MIKFRVWFEESVLKKAHMVDWEELKEFKGLSRLFDDAPHSETFSLMQSTGLKDKNGVEIFEGDVCKLSGGLDDYWYIVEWLFAGWQLVTYKKPDAKVSGISDGINQCYLEPSIASNLGIVGNIYANPELLSNP